MSRIESITIAPTTGRTSTPGRFEAALQGATRTLARGVAGAVELAAPAVPFGTVLAGAVRGAVGGGAGGAAGLAGSGGGARLAAGGGAAAVAGGGVAGAAEAGSAGDLLEATRVLQQEAQAMNLQYLQLQEQMQRESREFTALTNVMKVRHDSARAAIANIH
ncbi:MAG: hypothetical protein IPO09_04400 [Anaeromyxobacter sp.]|nr:hypothetical protein [Anaeromyxobacter sp.]MBL0275825.1 hypothetical protein [Anaeromyxobacter sp.]